MGLHEICATFVQTELSNLSQHYTMICPGNVKVTLERYRDEIEDLSSRFVSAYIAHVTHIDGLGDIRRDVYETESSDQDSPNIRNETPRINLTKSEPGIMAASVVMLKITDAHGIVSSHSNYERGCSWAAISKGTKSTSASIVGREGSCRQLPARKLQTSTHPRGSRTEVLDRFTDVKQKVVIYSGCYSALLDGYTRKDMSEQCFAILTYRGGSLLGNNGINLGRSNMFTRAFCCLHFCFILNTLRYQSYVARK
jgi:hypothetical protein